MYWLSKDENNTSNINNLKNQWTKSIDKLYDEVITHKFTIRAYQLLTHERELEDNQ
jgi:hypothetical protein